MSKYLFTHRVENFGAFTETTSSYKRLIGHLTADQIQAARISFANDGPNNVDPLSFIEVRFYQVDSGGEAETEPVYIVESSRMMDELKAGDSMALEVKKGAIYYMGALFMEIETQHNPTGGMSAPWKGVGDMVVTFDMRSPEV